MSQQIIQMKLISGEEIIAKRHPLYPKMYQDVMLIERSTVNVEDEYTGEVVATQIFYTMRSWLLHQFEKRDDDYVNLVELNPNTIMGAYLPHKNTIDQYMASIQQLSKTGDFSDIDAADELDSDWNPDSDSNIKMINRNKMN